MKDSRAAYVAIKHQYVGADHVNQQASDAEGILQNTIRTGRNRFTFKHYCTLHSQQHEILHRLQAHGNSGIDDTSKVRHLNNGIKDTALAGAKLATLSEVGNKKDFSTTLAYYRSVLTNHRAKRSRKPDVNISGFESVRGGRGGQKKTVKVGVAAGTARSVNRMATGATNKTFRRKMWNSGTTTQNSILT